MSALRVLGMCGSLRAEGLNARLLEILADAIPDADVEVSSLPARLPFYSPEFEGAPPVAAVQWREQIAASDLLLIVSPEYNYSVPALVKNAIDWASRPAGGGVLAGARAVITGAAPGRGGTTRGQLALRHILLSAECEVMGAPELAVSAPSGDLADPALRARIDLFTRAAAQFARRGATVVSAEESG